ncbi:MAG: exodeoxyribonuclease III [Deltaproteobacteria bacterium]|nr:exodeoxyribonuclease III [Deltaproteobacteria bacterium]
MPRLTVTTLNVNGIRSAERRGFSTWLARAKPDVLCLQEVRADEETTPPELWKPASHAARYFPAEKKGYSGTAVWSRCKTVKFSVGTGHARGDSEGRAVGVHLPGLDAWSLYMPSGSSGPDRQAWKFEYMEHVLPWLDGLLASGRPTVVCGDINIAHTPMDIKNAKSNEKNSGFLPEERRWLDTLVARGWRDAFRVTNPTSQAYSWWSQRGQARAKDVGWRIDHAWVSPGVTLVSSTIEREANLSDHAPVHVVVEVP